MDVRPEWRYPFTREGRHLRTGVVPEAERAEIQPH